MSARAVATALLLALAAVLSAVACDDDGGGGATPSPTAEGSLEITFAGPGPATFRVIGGRNDGAIDIERFLPESIHVRVGDTIEWVSSGYEGHTVTFAPPDFLVEMGDYLVPDSEDPEQLMFNPLFALPSDSGDEFANDGRLYNSGFIGVPSEGTYRLKFTEEGVFQYLCVVHPLWMRGTVQVDAADAQVQSPGSVSASAEAEYERLVADATRLRDEELAKQRSFPAPDGTSLHRVQVGLTTMYGQIAVFAPGDLQVRAGDTVIFENDDRNFHNVVFKGDLPEFPTAYEIRPAPEGKPGFNVALANESARPVDPPPAGFDANTFLSSGMMGVLQPRQTWRLTFTKPGTYVYNCTIHQFAGMAGVIEVVE